MQKIRVAGPPGTGKTTYLMKRYYDALDKYEASDIMVISHPKTAANEIREKINDPENIAKYHKETGKDLFNLIKETKKIRKTNVSTIHKYCKDEITKSKGGDVFEISDYERLKDKYLIFKSFADNMKTIIFTATKDIKMGLTTLFCEIHDFCQNFEPEYHKHLIDDGKIKRARKSTLRNDN